MHFQLHNFLISTENFKLATQFPQSTIKQNFIEVGSIKKKMCFDTINTEHSPQDAHNIHQQNKTKRKLRKIITTQIKNTLFICNQNKNMYKLINNQIITI